MNKIQQEDVEYFARNFELREDILGSNFLITGATGLIGSTLVHSLLALKANIHITCPVRNLEKAKRLFEGELEQIDFIECDLLVFLKTLASNNKYQYIIHCASPTYGNYMVEHPVMTYELAYESTKSLLQYAAKTNVDGFVYISSIEYYGQNADDRMITEDFIGYVDPLRARSSYPLGKRAAEYLCVAYAKEFQVPAKIARLTQTFGAGVSKEDHRVFAQFAQSIIDNEDIVLHTTGESAKPYCYTTDSISAILYILLRGQKGEAYNVANDETYITIRDMAVFLCESFNPNINVVFESNPEMGYAPVTKLNLSAKKLKALGWKPRYDLYEMFNRLIKSISKTT